MTKETTFLQKISAKVARTSRVLRTGSLTTFSSSQTIQLPAAVKLYRKEDVGVKSTLSKLRVCVTFKPLAVQVDFYLNEVSTGIDPSLSSPTVYI